MKRSWIVLGLALSFMASCKKGTDAAAAAGNCTSRNTCSIAFTNDYSSALDIKVYDPDNKLKLTITGLASGASVTRDSVPAGQIIVIWSGGTLSGTLSHYLSFQPCQHYTEKYYTTLPSDRRYKKDIEPVAGSEALQGLMQLKPASYEYDWLKFPLLNAVTGRTNGFMAQDLETVFPEVVVKDAAGYRSVNYAALVPVLTAAIQEQQKKIAALEKQMNGLKRVCNNKRK